MNTSVLPHSPGEGSRDGVGVAFQGNESSVRARLISAEKVTGDFRTSSGRTNSPSGVTARISTLSIWAKSSINEQELRRAEASGGPLAPWSLCGNGRDREAFSRVHLRFQKLLGGFSKMFPSPVRMPPVPPAG